MDAFAEKYCTIAYSRRYHFPDKCNGNETDYSATLRADDLAAFISRTGLDSAHVTGTSYEADTALLLASQYQKKVKSLVLLIHRYSHCSKTTLKVMHLKIGF